MKKLEITNQGLLYAIFKKVCAHSSESRLLHRLHCVQLVGRGCSCYQVAEWFGEHPRTIERWVHYLQEFGIEGLRDKQKTGRPTKVRDDQLKRIQNEISCNPTKHGYVQNSWDGRLLRTHLESRYEIALSVRQCQRLLRQFREQAVANPAPYQ